MDSTIPNLQVTLNNEEGEDPLKPVDAQDAATSQLHHEENLFTGSGLDITSFKKGYCGKGTLELNRPMGARHDNMTAIGGAIAAGFFIGAGEALSRSVGTLQPLSRPVARCNN